MFYEAKIKYTTIAENGKEKSKVDTILVECEFFSEAEKVALELYKDFRDADVIAIKRSALKEIINPDSELETTYKLTLKDLFFDERTGKEKFTTYHLLLFAENMDKAKKIADEHIKQGMEDLVFVGIKESPIVSVTTV